MWNKNKPSAEHVSRVVDNETKMILSISSSSSANSTLSSTASCLSPPGLSLPSTISSSSTTILSLSSTSPSSSILIPPTSLLSVEKEEIIHEVNVVNKNSGNKSTSFLSIDYNLFTDNKSIEKRNSTPVRAKHRVQYLLDWEKRPEARYKTFVFDIFGTKHEESICWLYFEENSMRCRLCEKYNKRTNTNGTSHYY